MPPPLTGTAVPAGSRSASPAAPAEPLPQGESTVMVTVVAACSGVVLSGVLAVLGYRLVNPGTPRPAVEVANELTSGLEPMVTGKADQAVIVPASSATGPAEAMAGPTASSATPLPLPEVIRRVEPSVMRINVMTPHGEVLGTGFLVDDHGTALTNRHVVLGAREATATFADGLQARVLGYLALSVDKDLAVLRLAGVAGRRPLRLAAELPEKGEAVAALGSPQGLAFSTTNGIVGASYAAAATWIVSAADCGRFSCRPAP